MPSNLEFGALSLKTTSNGIPELLDSWAQLCEDCFSEKESPPPKEYFLRHFYLDSNSVISVEENLSRIFVCTDLSSNQLCGSVRVYSRKIFNFISDSVLTVAGIGEVCTLKSFRNNGISTKLMELALSNPLSKLSILHAAPWIWPFYKKLGYQNLHMAWTSLTFPLEIPEIPSFPSNREVKISSLVTKDNAAVLCKLYSSFSQKFFGPLQRSEEYFSSWIGADFERAYVLRASDEILGYAIIGVRFGSYKVYDFGLCDTIIQEALANDSVKAAVRKGVLSLIQFALRTKFVEQQASGKSSSCNNGGLLPSIAVPSVLLSFLGCSADETLYTLGSESADEGWMIRGIDGAIPSQFLFWPVDHF